MEGACERYNACRAFRIEHLSRKSFISIILIRLTGDSLGE